MTAPDGCKQRRLRDLEGVGPKTLEDFELLGIRCVAQLARQDAERLFERLCGARGARVDICCLDVFTAAVAQARDPRLPADQRNWWYWSRVRKQEVPAPSGGGVRGPPMTR